MLQSEEAKHQASKSRSRKSIEIPLSKPDVLFIQRRDHSPSCPSLELCRVFRALSDATPDSFQEIIVEKMLIPQVNHTLTTQCVHHQ